MQDNSILGTTATPEEERYPPRAVPAEGSSGPYAGNRGLCHPWLVLLPSADGASVSLSINGYEFPAQPARGNQDWDANWLQIHGEITQADGRTWSFTDPSLTTWEAGELGIWLRRAGSGDVPASALTPGGPVELLHFTEPNIAFSVESRNGRSIRIRAHFSLEALPPRLTGQQRPRLFDYFVPLNVSAGTLADAADAREHELALFPER